MTGTEKKPAAWLLTADRYMAEIAEAERVEALAAAARHKAAPARVSASSRPRKASGSRLVVLAQVRGWPGTEGLGTTGAHASLTDPG